MQKPLRLLTLCLMSGVSACAWVKPTPRGEQVMVLSEQAVRDCTPAGTTHVSVLDKLGKLRRSEGKVSAELETLARNSAAQLGGNAVVPISDIDNGTQSFAVYKCEPGALSN